MVAWISPWVATIRFFLLPEDSDSRLLLLASGCGYNSLACPTIDHAPGASWCGRIWQ